MNRDGFFVPKGLRFACTACGACCRGAPGAVRLTIDEMRSIAAYVDMTAEVFSQTCLRQTGGRRSLKEHPDGACIFLEGDRCRIHPVKPGQCRRYPFWIRTLRSEEAWTREKQVCPGIGQGRRYSADEILKKLHEEFGEVCPAGWQKGENGMKATPEGVAAFLSTASDRL